MKYKKKPNSIDRQLEFLTFRLLPASRSVLFPLENEYETITGDEFQSTRMSAVMNTSEMKMDVSLNATLWPVESVSGQVLADHLGQQRVGLSSARHVGRCRNFHER